MKKLNTTTDTQKYLASGNLTQPFLPTDYVLEMVMRDFNHKKEAGIKNTEIESLFNWIVHCVKLSDFEEFKNENRFMRTAQEIWESKLATGCTDYATLFATFARQLNYPTTILHTAEQGWLTNFLNNKKCSLHRGHTFCECFYKEKWILVDPTYKKIEYDYNPEKLVLSYKVGPGNIYIPYKRDLDLERKMTTKEHNFEMEEACKKLQQTK